MTAVAQPQTPAQSLRRQIDKLAQEIQGKASQIETLTDLAADVLSEMAGEPTPRHINHLVNLTNMAIALSREAGDLGEAIERRCHRIPAEVEA